MREIKAAVLYEYRQPMKIERVQLDDPQPGEVLVKIAASGVCRSDLHVIKQEWTSPLPIVLGHEAAGTVEAVGPNVTRVKPGDAIVLSFAPNCGYCAYCTTGRAHLCATMRREPAGMLPGGSTRLHKDGQPIHHFGRTASFAEYAVIHESSAIPITRDVPIELAALVGCAVTTGVGAVLNTARVAPGSTVAVIGCGGVGLNVIQGARLVNASRIIAVDVSQEKLEFARRFGATDDIDAREEDTVRRIKQLTDGGVDYAFEVLGSGPTIRTAIDAVRSGGTAVVVGMAPAGEEAAIDAYLLAAQEKTLKGSFYGSARTSVDMPMLVSLARAGRIDLDALVTRRYPLEEINEAYAALDRGELGRGLIVFDN
jgi:S-(hydroxymethyl)glutathione dehydrogenase / alcohol dehydrogenase